ncbi:hypothetical protein LTR15_012699 [Elasticomyces elasticus]|nr:hypothetical protein LTR15_012699 [Elasticomyces elasticus]
MTKSARRKAHKAKVKLQAEAALLKRKRRGEVIPKRKGVAARRQREDDERAAETRRRVKARAKRLGPLLFRLPAELRNEIYEMVLLQRNPVHSIQVNRDLRVPALLQVSRQVREETLKIWFEGNGFYYTVRDCNATVMVAWERHCRPLGLYEINAELMMVGKPNWANLRKWCKTICLEGVRGACPEGCLTACGEECLASRQSSSGDFKTEARHTVIISATDIACGFFGKLVR